MHYTPNYLPPAPARGKQIITQNQNGKHTKQKPKGLMNDEE
jgi:hypothetical protein